MGGVIAALLAYLVFLTALGFGLGRRVSKTSDFFVAGRSLSPFLLFGTVLAANIGAGSTVGAAGLGYRDGLAAWWWVGSAGIGTLLLALWVGPRMWRIAKEHELLTVGDYLEFRFGPSVRGTVSTLLWVGTLAILAGQLIAMAEIVQVVAGLPRWAGAVMGAIVMTIYFAAGGLLSSVWVNLVQLVVLFVGFLVALPMAVSGAGGIEALIQLGESLPGYLDPVSGDGSGWIYLTLLVPAFIVSPGLLQKTFAARDETAVRRGLALAGVVLILFAFIPPLMGMVARVIAPNLPHHELALPVLLVEGVPRWIGVLGLAAVLSAEISSADAILFMLSTSLSQDLYRRFVRPDATELQVLRVARWAAIVGGGAGLILALALPSVVDSLRIFYSLLGVSLFVPIVAGLHLRGFGVREALVAIGSGVTVLLLARSGVWVLPAWITPTLQGIFVGGVATLLLLAVTRPDRGIV